MQRSVSIHTDERQVNIGAGRCGKLFLCFLSRLFQTLQSHLVIGKIYTVQFLEFGNHPVRNFLVEIIAAQVVVAGSCQYLDNAVADLDDRHIESTAAQVVYHDFLLFFIVQAVCKGCRRRLVDDTFYIQPGDLSCVLGSLSLGVIEICRNSDDCFRHFLAQIILRVCFQLLQDHSGDLLRRIFLAVDLYFIISSHVSLDGRDRLLGISHCLTFCRFAYQTLSGLGKCHDRRCCSRAFRIGDNRRFTAFHDSHTRVRSS